MISSGIYDVTFASVYSEKTCLKKLMMMKMMMNMMIIIMNKSQEAITTSLIPLETILPEECAFIIGFSCTVWTTMRSLLAH